MSKKYIVTMEFLTQDAADQFIAWMDGQGEQDMEIWWDCRKYEGLKVGSHQFDYDYKTQTIKQRGKK